MNQRPPVPLVFVVFVMLAWVAAAPAWAKDPPAVTKLVEMNKRAIDAFLIAAVVPAGVCDARPDSCPPDRKPETFQLEDAIRPGSAFGVADRARSAGASLARAGSAPKRPANSGASTYCMMPV